MRLPDPLFTALKPHFSHHGCWHKARRQAQEELRRQFEGECGSGLHGIDEVGSGCDFLRFHRRMIQHFEFELEQIELQQIELPGFTLERWGTELPGSVAAILLESFPDFDLGACHAGLAARAAAGQIEDLGAFCEPNLVHLETPGAGIHNKLHTALGALEAKLEPPETEAPMKDLGRAPGNALFWTLHYWIDDFYAVCQVAAGETVDRRPRRMRHQHITC